MENQIVEIAAQTAANVAQVTAQETASEVATVAATEAATRGAAGGVMAGVAGVIAGSPVIIAVAGTALVGGAAYLAYKKWFADKSASKKTIRMTLDQAIAHLEKINAANAAGANIDWSKLVIEIVDDESKADKDQPSVN